MKNPGCFWYLLAFYLCPLAAAISAELDLRLSGEAGLYRAQTQLQTSEANFLSRFSGWLKLQETADRSAWNLSLQLKPELYQGDLSYSVLKFISRGQFSQAKNSWQWGLGFDARKYSYFSINQNSSFDFFKLEGFFSSYFSRKFNLSLIPAYYYRDLTTQQLDAFSGDFSFSAISGNKFNIGLGGYLENFRLSADLFPGFATARQSNVGWRYGPEFTLNYLKKIYFSLRYIFLWHRSEITVSPSYEQYLRLFISRKIAKNWIMFFVVDYFWNDIQLQNLQDEMLLYIPFENENHVDLKLEKLIQKNIFLSGRIGYFKDNYILPEFSVEGWQALLGLELEY
jgi:hypothetical protein